MKKRSIAFIISALLAVSLIVVCIGLYFLTNIETMTLVNISVMLAGVALYNLGAFATFSIFENHSENVYLDVTVFDDEDEYEADSAVTLAGDPALFAARDYEDLNKEVDDVAHIIVSTT